MTAMQRLGRDEAASCTRQHREEERALRYTQASLAFWNSERKRSRQVVTPVHDQSDHVHQRAITPSLGWNRMLFREPIERQLCLPIRQRKADDHVLPAELTPKAFR